MASEWLQNWHNIQVHDTFELGKLYFELPVDSFLHSFWGSVIFPYISLYTQAVPYTMYAEPVRTKGSQKHMKKTNFELGKPVIGLVYSCHKYFSLDYISVKYEAGTKVRPDQLGSPVWVVSTRINSDHQSGSDQLRSTLIIEKSKINKEMRLLPMWKSIKSPEISEKKRPCYSSVSSVLWSHQLEQVCTLIRGSLFWGWRRVFAWSWLASKLAVWCVIGLKLAWWVNGHHWTWYLICYFTTTQGVICHSHFRDR